MPFEIQALPATGSISAIVQDPSGQVPELTIIQIPDAWAVNVQWSISGAAVPAFAPTAQWHVRVSLESLGPGLEAIVGQITEPMGAPALSHSYNRTINVPGNFPGLTPGAYKLTTVVTLENGGVPCPLAGYVEGPVLQFYQFP
jgi:hypothetical protein